MWSLLRGEPDRVVNYAAFIVCAGFALIVLSPALDGHGIITGFFLAALGVSGASLSKWRFERGLWMYAVVFIFVYGFFYAISIFEQIMDVIQGAPPNNPALVMDFSIGSLLLVTTLKFLFRVARENYRIFHAID